MTNKEKIIEAAREHGWDVKELRRVAPAIQLSRHGIRVVVSFTTRGRVHDADLFREGSVVLGFVAPRESQKAARVLAWLKEEG